MRSRLLSLVLAPLLVACGSDYAIQYVDPPPEEASPPFPAAASGAPAEPAATPVPPVQQPTAPAPVAPECTASSKGFDIEEVSTLQDGFGLPSIRDGLALSVDAAQVGDGWRPTAVEVLVMYPDWYFDLYDGSNTLTVQVFGAATPVGQPYTLSLPISRAGLSWEPLTLPADADWSGDDLQQVAAWLRFDLADVIPAGAFVDREYFVSVGWDGHGFPNVGYSNFELDCAQNWTDHGGGVWQQNSGQDCSWPMMKIELETSTAGDCR